MNKKKIRQLRMFTKPDHHATKPIKGPGFVESCGKCELAPWEQCACSFRHDQQGQPK